MIVTATGSEEEKAKAATSGIRFAGAWAELRPGIRTYRCPTASSDEASFHYPLPVQTPHVKSERDNSLVITGQTDGEQPRQIVLGQAQVRASSDLFIVPTPASKEGTNAEHTESDCLGGAARGRPRLCGHFEHERLGEAQ